MVPFLCCPQPSTSFLFISLYALKEKQIVRGGLWMGRRRRKKPKTAKIVGGDTQGEGEAEKRARSSSSSSVLEPLGEGRCP